MLMDVKRAFIPVDRMDMSWSVGRPGTYETRRRDSRGQIFTEKKQYACNSTVRPVGESFGHKQWRRCCRPEYYKWDEEAIYLDGWMGWDGSDGCKMLRV